MWPNDEERSGSGFVGLTNLGATCYMATCMQHLYMIPEARKSILEADVSAADSRHQQTLMELKKMFAYLLVCILVDSGVYSRHFNQTSRILLLCTSWSCLAFYRIRGEILVSIYYGV